jgi:integrase
VRFHDLRHTFASHLITDLGLDVAQVRRILGHGRWADSHGRALDRAERKAIATTTTQLLAVVEREPSPRLSDGLLPQE